MACTPRVKKYCNLQYENTVISNLEIMKFYMQFAHAHMKVEPTKNLFN